MDDTDAAIRAAAIDAVIMLAETLADADCVPAQWRLEQAAEEIYPKLHRDARQRIVDGARMKLWRAG